MCSSNSEKGRGGPFFSFIPIPGCSLCTPHREPCLPTGRAPPQRAPQAACPCGPEQVGKHTYLSASGVPGSEPGALLSCCLVGNRQAGRPTDPVLLSLRRLTRESPLVMNHNLKADGGAGRCSPWRLAGGAGSWVVEMRPDVPSSLRSRKGGKEEWMKLGISGAFPHNPAFREGP